MHSRYIPLPIVYLIETIYLYACSVHIKVHVPEIIKKHTHHRTIYKHHYKVKPKPKPPRKPHSHHHHHNDYEHHSHHYGDDEHEYDRVDPSIRHGTLHAKHQRPYWKDHLIPSASHHKESRHRPRAEMLSSTSTESSYPAADSPEILTRWKHNFKLLNRKPPAKKTAKKKGTTTPRPTSPPPPPEYTAEPEEEEHVKQPYEQFDFNEQYYGDLVGTQHDHHIFKQPGMYQEQSPKFPSFTYPEMPKLNDPYAPKFEAYHSSYKPSDDTQHSEFQAPHLLKITEDDIRKRPKQTSSKKSPSPAASSYGSDSYLNWDTSSWTTEKPEHSVEHLYLRPTSSALTSMAEQVSQEEFMPFKQPEHQHHHHHYQSYSTQSDKDTEEPEDEADEHDDSERTDFGMAMAPMTDELYQTFTKRKNIRSGQNPLLISMSRR